MSLMNSSRRRRGRYTLKDPAHASVSRDPAAKQRRIALERGLMTNQEVTVGIRHAAGLTKIVMTATQSIEELKIKVENELGVPRTQQELCLEPGGQPIPDHVCMARHQGATTSCVLYLTQIEPAELTLASICQDNDCIVGAAAECDVELEELELLEPSEDWLCPITRDVIYTPAMLDHQVYELDALAGWLSRNPSNPLTRAAFDYENRLHVDTELQEELANWRAHASKLHCEFAAAGSNDPAKVVIHLTNAIEAHPRDPEGYERLATHLEASGDSDAAIKVRDEAHVMMERLEAATKTYTLNVAGDRAQIIPQIAQVEDQDGYHDEYENERELDVGGVMALLAVAQVSKGIVWGIALNSTVAGASSTAATGGVATAGATAGAGAAVSMAGGLLAFGACALATFGAGHQVSANRSRKRKSFFKVQRLLGRHR